MKIIKRFAIFSIILSLVMQMTAFSAVIPNDAIGTKYEKAINTLCDLEIMIGDGEGFKPEKTITRGEFAQLLMNILKFDLYTEGYSYKGTFSDVEPDSYYAGAVEMGVINSIINGYDDGTFRPSNDVTGYEAIKMMLCAINYQTVAENRGGFPSGYAVTAGELGVLNGLAGINYSSAITRGQVAQLVVNTLNTDYLQVTEVGEDDVTYKPVKGKNILSDIHKIYRFEGTVTANDFTSIQGSEALKEGYIQISADNKSYNFYAPSYDRSELLGKYAEIYYSSDESETIQTVLNLNIIEKRAESIELSLSAIDYEQSDSETVVYWKNKDTDSKGSTIKVDSLPDIIFNGIAENATNLKAVLTSVEGKDGKIIFINNDGDNEYDLVNISAYETYFAGQIYKNDFLITDQLGKYEYSLSENKSTKKNKNLTVDLDASGVIASFKTADGKLADFTDIKVNDVLSVASNTDGSDGVKSYEIIISRATVSGKIDGIADEGNELLISIDGVQYGTTNSFINYVTRGKGLSGNIELTLGSNGLFYLDCFGKIAACDFTKGVTTEDLIFGVITGYAPPSTPGGVTIARIYSNGVLDTYEFAGKIVLDGVTRSVNEITAYLDETVSLIGTVYYNDGVPALPAMIRLDSNKKVRYIDSLYYNEEAESPYTLRYVKGTNGVTKNTYISNAESFNYKYPVSKATVIQIPSRDKSYDLGSKERYSCYSATLLGNDKAYSAQLFNTDPDSYSVDYVLIQQSAFSGYYTALGSNQSEIHDKQMFIVSRVTNVVDSEGNQTIKVYGLEEGRGKEFVVNHNYFNEKLHQDIWDMSWFSSVKMQIQDKESEERKTKMFLPGDIIRYRTNPEGELAYVRPVYLSDVKAFRCDDQGGLDTATRYRAQDLAVVAGIEGTNMLLRYIVDKSTGNSQASTVLNINNDGYLLTDATGVQIYNEAEGEYCEGSTVGEMRVDALHDSSKFSIMVYEASTGKVRNGNFMDIYDTTWTDKPASIVIMQFRSAIPRGMIIIKNQEAE